MVADAGLQKEVEHALLISSRRSGPPQRRAIPSKAPTKSGKKVLLCPAVANTLHISASWPYACVASTGTFVISASAARIGGRAWPYYSQV